MIGTINQIEWKGGITKKCLSQFSMPTCTFCLVAQIQFFSLFIRYSIINPWVAPSVTHLTRDPNVPGSTPTERFLKKSFLKKTVLKNYFNAIKKTIKCLIFVIYMNTFYPKRCKKLKESRSLSSIKLL